MKGSKDQKNLSKCNFHAEILVSQFLVQPLSKTHWATFRIWCQFSLLTESCCALPRSNWFTL